MSDQAQSFILNVDDDEIGRYAINRILRQAGFQVIEAANGAEALRQARERRPDLVLLDVHLPDTSGYEVCSRLKSEAATVAIPVLMLSATSITPRAVVKGLSGGADGYLTEPIEPEVLIAYIRALLRARQAEVEAAAMARQWQTTFDAIDEGVCLLDEQGQILRCNRAFAGITGKAPAEIIGRHYSEFIPGDYPLPGLESRVISLNGRWFQVSQNPVPDDQDSLVSSVYVLSDITQRRQGEEQLRASLAEKEVLLREVHHRVKNNLQAVQNLLYMQSCYIQDEQVLDMLRNTQDRVKSISLIHEKLYQAKDLAHINFADYIRGLAEHLVHSYKIDPEQIALKVVVDDISLDVDRAIPLGVITCELISNSLEHGLPGNRPGEVRVELRQDTGHELVLTVGDNGVGMPPELDIRQTSSLGLQLIHLLSGHMGGRVEVQREGGTVFRVIFPAFKGEAG